MRFHWDIIISINWYIIVDLIANYNCLLLLLLLSEISPSPAFNDLSSFNPISLPFISPPLQVHRIRSRGASVCELVLVHCTRTKNRKRFHATTLAVKEGHSFVIVPRKLEKMRHWCTKNFFFLNKYWVNGSIAKLYLHTDYSIASKNYFGIDSLLRTRL